MFDATQFENVIRTMDNGRHSREQIRDRIKQEIARTMLVSGLRYERLSGEDNANVSRPIVEEPHNVMNVILFLARLNELLEEFGGEIKTFHGSAYIEPKTSVAIPVKTTVPSSLLRCDYEWGYSQGDEIHFTGKLIDLAFILKRRVFKEGVFDRQIYEAVVSCHHIHFIGRDEELYEKLRRIRERNKDLKDGEYLTTLLKNVLRKS
ncbi:MAG: hypothetical protein IPP80_12845 [Ignavibacteria bacterium]|nr:hypothetical protein [Ignavibacteria bacterium]